MPQAPKYLQDMWADDQAAIKYLISQGYILRKDWHWESPKVNHVVTEKEGHALDYLFLEWDFGGIYDGHDHPDL